MSIVVNVVMYRRAVAELLPSGSRQYSRVEKSIGRMDTRDWKAAAAEKDGVGLVCRESHTIISKEDDVVALVIGVNTG